MPDPVPGTVATCRPVRICTYVHSRDSRLDLHMTAVIFETRSVHSISPAARPPTASAKARGARSPNRTEFRCRSVDIRCVHEAGNMNSLGVIFDIGQWLAFGQLTCAACTKQATQQHELMGVIFDISQWLVVGQLTYAACT